MKCNFQKFIEFYPQSYCEILSFFKCARQQTECIAIGAAAAVAAIRMYFYRVAVENI